VLLEEQDKIEQLEAQRDASLGKLGTPAKVDGRKGPRKGGKKRKMSAAGRRAIAAAQKNVGRKKRPEKNNQPLPSKTRLTFQSGFFAVLKFTSSF
jgi:hypothetical protein